MNTFLLYRVWEQCLAVYGYEIMTYQNMFMNTFAVMLNYIH